ncbi:calcium-binding protein [Nostoc sp. FACHB-973]|nr:calcium-binding protein [Nostoc sp. FACHB-973]
MANIIGTNGNDTLQDIYGDDTLTGGGGNDKFVYDGLGYYSTDVIADFGGLGKGTHPTAAVIAEVDTLIFIGAGFTAKNLLLTQNGKNLEISFQGFGSRKLILDNFALENLDNLSKSTGASVDLGNILFDGQTTTTDSFDVFNANSTQSTIFNKNTVTFLNDLDNNVSGFDNSDDVINGQGGDDIINGLSGNDLLRGGAGDNTLNGGVGDDNLNVDFLSSNNLLNGGDGNDSLKASGDKYYNSYDKYGYDLRPLGNNTLNGGAGTDTLDASGSKGDNLLDGGDGNDTLTASGGESIRQSLYDNSYNYTSDTRSLGNNTLNGGAGNDNLGARGSTGDNLLDGGDGNDYLDISGEESEFENFRLIEGYYVIYRQGSDNLRSSGNNTLNGGAGNDFLNAGGSTGDNLLDGGDGNDYLDISGIVSSGGDFNRSSSDSSSLGNNTLNGGAGDDNLNARGSKGDNLLFGADGNDSLDISSYIYVYADYIEEVITSGDNLLDGGDGNDSLTASYALGNNTLNGGNGDDILTSANGTVDGGEGDDLWYFSDNTTGAIASTFNALTNIGEIREGTNQVTYKNIERLNISGTKYNDNIVGTNGNDTLSTGDAGNDTIDGGNGDDLLTVNYKSPTRGIASTFNATTNTGSITVGTNRVSYKNIEGLNISGTGYNDNIVGTNGNDTLSTSGGNDTIDGGKGNDLLTFNSDYYHAITSSFNATTNIGSITNGTNQVSYKNIEGLNILGTNYDDLIVGSNGNDTLSTGNTGNDTINAGTGDDLLTVSLVTYNATEGITSTFIDGGTGDDLLSVYVNYDATTGITSTFDASSNIGSIKVGTRLVSYKNIEGLNISGTFNDDKIVGSNGNDTLSTNYYGNDTIDGGTGDDLLTVNIDSDASTGITSTFNASTNIGSITVGTRLVSYKNIERLDISGTNYDDLIVGNNGDDSLYGGGGNNTIIGGEGNDYLISSYSSNDTLYGGAGIDTFALYRSELGFGTIYDFDPTNELIQLSKYDYDLSVGVLSASEFTIGASATTSAQRFIYNSTTGALYFDSDGSAAGFTQVQFAQLSAGLSLTNNNFVFV